MMENETRSETMNEGQKPLVEQSPDEKLETKTPVSPATPGVENPDSTEVKEETRPNTE